MPTLQSRRLILSSYWTYIRLPNYFGEILLHTALLLPLIHKFDVPSFVGILWIVLFLLHTIPRLNARNSKRYELSWQRYTSAVKYNIIPKVY
jgi:steroid 5-alpha reductase family enzyme